MRPVWVIDDDRSIRWVFEKALAREGIPFKTFAQAAEAMNALDEAARRRCWFLTSACQGRRVWNCCRT
jgi:DNA-binding NtrC family response regulator